MGGRVVKCCSKCMTAYAAISVGGNRVDCTIACARGDYSRVDGGCSRFIAGRPGCLSLATA